MSGVTTLSALSLSAAAVNVTSTVATAAAVQASPSKPIFLQTKMAQGIAGTFVFAALFLTCQQVMFIMIDLEIDMNYADFKDIILLVSEKCY